MAREGGTETIDRSAAVAKDRSGLSLGVDARGLVVEDVLTGTSVYAASAAPACTLSPLTGLG